MYPRHLEINLLTKNQFSCESDCEIKLSLNVLQWNGLFLPDKIPLPPLNLFLRDGDSAEDKSRKNEQNILVRKSRSKCRSCLVAGKVDRCTRRWRVQNR